MLGYEEALWPKKNWRWVMPVKFWQTSVRLWFFLSYLITTIWVDFETKKQNKRLPAKRWKLQIFFCLLTFASAEPFSLIGLVVTLFSGAPWAVTKCFRRYHLFFTTLSHSEQDTPCDWMCTLTICCFKLKELENVFQQ